MAVIRQISVYDGNSWNTNDIGANAINIKLTNSAGTSSSTIAGATTLQDALNNILPTTKVTANRVLVSDASQKISSSDITSDQLGYLNGVTSNIQDQINEKVSKAGDTITGDLLLSQNANIIQTTQFQPLSSSYTPSSSVDLLSPSNIIHVRSATDTPVARINAIDRRIDNAGMIENYWGLSAVVFSNNSDGNQGYEVANLLDMGVNPQTGDPKVYISAPKAWVNALNLNNPILSKSGNSVSIPSESSYVTLTSATVSPGVYIIWYHGSFAGSTKGVRLIDLSITRNGTTNNGYGTLLVAPAPSVNMNTQISGTMPISLETNATVALRGWQNSGSTLGAVGQLRFLKIHDYNITGLQPL